AWPSLTVAPTTLLTLTKKVSLASLTVSPLIVTAHVFLVRPAARLWHDRERVAGVVGGSAWPGQGAEDVMAAVGGGVVGGGDVVGHRRAGGGRQLHGECRHFRATVSFAERDVGDGNSDRRFSGNRRRLRDAAIQRRQRAHVGAGDRRGVDR